MKGYEFIERFYYCDADVIREDMTAVEAKNTCEDCFGYDDIEV